MSYVVLDFLVELLCHRSDDRIIADCDDHGLCGTFHDVGTHECHVVAVEDASLALHRFRILCGRFRLPGKSGLIDLEMIGFHDPDISGDHVPGVQDQYVSCHEVHGVHFGLHALTAHGYDRGDHIHQFGGGLPAARLLDERHGTADQDQCSEDDEIDDVRIQYHPEDIDDSESYREHIHERMIQPLQDHVGVVIGNDVLTVSDT